MRDRRLLPTTTPAKRLRRLLAFHQWSAPRFMIAREVALLLRACGWSVAVPVPKGKEVPNG